MSRCLQRPVRPGNPSSLTDPLVPRLTNRWARQRAGEASKFAGAMMTQRVVGKHGGDDDNVRRYSRGLHAVLKTTSVCCYSERGSSKWDRLRPFITH
jgi:hypothetical protein